MRKKGVDIEQILWILAASFALLLRLLHLGGLPLTDWEAANALQAFDWIRSGMIPSGSQPGYVLTAGLFFQLFGSSNFAARLIPALAGSLLALSPYLFRKSLGRWPALIAAFGLALDPALAAISRQADGASWTLAFSFLSIGFALNGRKIWAGFCLGMALLGGPVLWLGWLGLAIAVLIVGRSEILPADGDIRSLASRELWITALLTLAAAGTLFLFAPFGLSMAAGSLADFFGGWATPGTMSLNNAVVGLLTYAWLPLLLGAVRGISAWIRREPLDQFLSFWWLTALLLWMAYPGRQPGGAGWVMLPMWALAARQAADWLYRPNANLKISLAAGVTVFVLLFFMVINSVAMLHPMSWSANFNVQVVKIVVAVVVLVLAVVLAGLGWSWDSAWQGVRWGSGSALLVILISMSVHAAGLGNKPQAEIWRTGPYFTDADLLQQTLQDLSLYKNGQINQVQVSVVGLSSPALNWMLREFPEVQSTSALSLIETPDVIISDDRLQPGQISTYRGQDFRWQVQPAWDLMTGKEWVSWLVFRDYPEEAYWLILWARTDLFPGENVAPSVP